MKLLSRRFPDAAPAIDAGQLHMVDVKQMGLTKIQTRDGGWVEVDHAGRTVRTYGKPGYADKLAKAIYDADYADRTERLEETQSVQRHGSGIRGRRRKADPVPQIPLPEVETRADRWRSRGFTDITEASDGTWIRCGNCQIQDLGDELRVHGKPNEAAVRAMLLKAQDEWGSEVEIFGSKTFKDALWLEGQRVGVAVYDQETGELYQPSPDVRKAFEADKAKNAADTVDLDGIRNNKAIAALVREAAAGDTAALAKLENSDPSLTDFITLHLDDRQRSQLAGKPEGDIAEALPDFREYGKAAREADDERRGTGKRPTSGPPEFGAIEQDNETPEARAALTRAVNISRDDEQELDDEMDLAAEAAKAEAEEQERQHSLSRRPE